MQTYIDLKEVSVFNQWGFVLFIHLRFISSIIHGNFKVYNIYLRNCVIVSALTANILYSTLNGNILEFTIFLIKIIILSLKTEYSEQRKLNNADLLSAGT